MLYDMLVDEICILVPPRGMHHVCAVLELAPSGASVEDAHVLLTWEKLQQMCSASFGAQDFDSPDAMVPASRWYQ